VTQLRGRHFGLVLGLALGLNAIVPCAVQADDPWVVYDGFDGPGKGKHIVLVSGDEEYRSEEALPQLGKILAKRHGFKCTVLFAIDKKDGTINPNQRDNIPGLEALQTADLAIFFLRFRDLPDDQMKHVVDYIESGKPMIGLRTATHSFNIPNGKTYARYSFNNRDWDGGFGRQVLGETWISHHGKHGSQSCRGIVAEDQQAHPILRGIKSGDIWGPTDVYGVRLPLPGDSLPLVYGQVLTGMKVDDPPVEGKQNNPLMPLAWTRTYKGAQGQTAKVFTTTMGSSQDLQSEGFRRLLVNASYWGLGMECQIPERSNVELVGEFEAHPFRHSGFTPGVVPSSLSLKR